MNREDIIKLAREAGLAYGSDEKPLNSVTRFAALVAAHEREACAKVCEDIDTEYEGQDVLATWCAAAIRARGKQ
jgi:hypothetical protein